MGKPDPAANRSSRCYSGTHRQCRRAQAEVALDATFRAPAPGTVAGIDAYSTGGDTALILGRRGRAWSAQRCRLRPAMPSLERWRMRAIPDSKCEFEFQTINSSLLRVSGQLCSASTGGTFGGVTMMMPGDGCVSVPCVGTGPVCAHALPTKCMTQRVAPKVTRSAAIIVVSPKVRRRLYAPILNASRSPL
jgi:hypothetical protein